MHHQYTCRNVCSASKHRAARFLGKKIYSQNCECDLKCDLKISSRFAVCVRLFVGLHNLSRKVLKYEIF